MYTLVKWTFATPLFEGEGTCDNGSAEHVVPRFRFYCKSFYLQLEKGHE